jgi:hypothetical protein
MIILFKGWEGWCDRLQVLTHLINYCLKYDARLCVDWEDWVWGGDEFGFNEVFELIGVKTASKNEVLKAMIQQDAKIEPPAWTWEDAYYRMPSVNGRLIGKEAKPLYIPSIMCSGEVPRVDADVILTNGDGTRTYDSIVFLNNVRLRPWVLEGIKSILNDFDPNSIVIHLRGTDRPEEKYVESAINVLKDEHRLPIYAITDDRKLWEEFKAGVPHAKLVNPNSTSLRIKLPEKLGIHFAKPSELKEQGITKKQLLIELLAEWFALCFAQSGFGRDVSTYYSMARKMHAIGNDVISQNLFGGWMPTRKTLETNNEANLLPCGQQTEASETTGSIVPSSPSVC